MKYTIKQLRDALPENVAQMVGAMLTERRIRFATVSKADRFYVGEDHKYTTVMGTNTRTTSVGGEWGGLENVRTIGKVVQIPVGAYVIETCIFLGKHMIHVYHNAGEAQIAA